MNGSQPMKPGDLLVFHSQLMHCSTDNVTQGLRAAMVYHYAHATTTGLKAFNQDWTEVLRDAEPVAPSTEPIPVSR